MPYFQKTGGESSSQRSLTRQAVITWEIQLCVPQEVGAEVARRAVGVSPLATPPEPRPLARLRMRDPDPATLLLHPGLGGLRLTILFSLQIVGERGGPAAARLRGRQTVHGRDWT